MACAIFQGYTRDCQDAIGGIKAVYFTELASLTSVTEASGVASVVTMATGKKFWKYELGLGADANSTASQKPTPTNANGTYFVDQELIIQIPKHTAPISYSIKTLAINNLPTIVEKVDGTFWLMGKTTGLRMQPSSNNFGKMQNDFNGFELVFKGMEPDLATQIPSNLMTALQLPA